MSAVPDINLLIPNMQSIPANYEPNEINMDEFKIDDVDDNILLQTIV